MFCPHSVNLHLIWISEQTDTLYLFTFSLFVFVAETECVYELSLYTIQVSFKLQRDLIKLHTSKYETPLEFIK